MSRRKRLHATEGEDFEPTGAVIASGTVPGRAVTWKAPNVDRKGGCYGGRDYERFREWKKTIHVHAKQAFRRRGPYLGPVALTATFYVRPVGNWPDATNLLKAFEDALQTVVYENDRQVADTRAIRVMTSEEPERVEWEVRAV